MLSFYAVTAHLRIHDAIHYIYTNWFHIILAYHDPLPTNNIPGSGEPLPMFSHNFHDFHITGTSV